MSQLELLEHFNAWQEISAKGLPSERLAYLFGETLKNFSKRASHALTKVTLMAIVKRVLYKSSVKYPVLSKLQVDSTGIPADQFKDLFSQVDPKELTEAFRFFINEFLTILGDLTGDILPTSLEEQKKAAAFSEKRQAGQRIDQLFEISKIFAGFDTVEKTFPEIFMILGNTFSFQTILLIEKKAGEGITSVWHNANTGESRLKRAFDYSRRSYEYLVGPLSHHDVETYESVTKHVLPISSLEKRGGDEIKNKFITIPLTLSSLQPFGVLQFESITPLSEEDLRFINSISNLLAITLDRFNKEQDSKKLRQDEFTKSTKELLQVHEYVKDLEKERDLREQFVSILTHDLRTPLTAAKMAAQGIAKRPERIDKNKTLANKVVSNIDRMDQMIKDLLDASRIRAGESLAMSMSRCDMRAIASDTLRELSSTYGDRFMLETDREPINGYWNADGIRRVLENLVNNAVKYGGPEQLITVKIKQADDTIQLIVHNTGNPISPDELPYLFLPFHRTSSAQCGEKKGWGLGLTLVRGVVEAHGGSVKVLSNKNDGTSFVVVLPKDSRPFQAA